VAVTRGLWRSSNTSFRAFDDLEITFCGTRHLPFCSVAAHSITFSFSFFDCVNQLWVLLVRLNVPMHPEGIPSFHKLTSIPELITVADSPQETADILVYLDPNTACFAA